MHEPMIETQKAINFVEEYGYKPFIEVINRFLISDLYERKSRCGIFILNFTDGESYVGIC